MLGTKGPKVTLRSLIGYRQHKQSCRIISSVWGWGETETETEKA